jgi:UDP-glucose 4-epimerase
MGKHNRSRVLIVGGAGYIGARFASALCAHSDVVVTARSLSVERKQWLDRHAGKIDCLLFNSAIDKRLPVEGEFDCIINLASPSAAEAALHEEASCQQALQTVRACIELMKIGSAARLIHFSSFHVYGAHQQILYSENDQLRPTQSYGRIHLHCEQLLNDESNAWPIFIVRPTNIVGIPAHGELGAQSSLVFLDLCKQAMQAGYLSLRSNGSAYRDFVTMMDAIDALTILLTAPPASLSNGGVLNLASGTTLSLSDLAKQVQSEAQIIAARPVGINFGSGTDSFPQPFHVTNERLCALGWQPHNMLHAEIRQALDFFSTRVMV